MANDFSGDSDCVALWKFDNDATDSKGGNDLTPVNSPAYDSADKKEGAYCIDFEESSDQYGSIADASLDAGFPGKSGTSEQSFSICGWFKPESFANFAALVNKYSTTTGRSYAVVVLNTGYVTFYIGYNSGNSSTYITFDTALSTGKWYHIAAVYDSSDNGMKLRIWDDDSGALLDSNKESTAGGDMSPTSTELRVGKSYGSSFNLDGKVDEVVIFKRALTDSEIDQIRAGTYGAATGKSSADSGSGADAKESYPAAALDGEETGGGADAKEAYPTAALSLTETGGGVEAVVSLQTPQAKTSAETGAGVEVSLSGATLAGSESGSGLEMLIARLLAGEESGSAAEVSSLDKEGELENLLAEERGEGTDRLAARIEMPVKGGGMRLWT